ncbi:alpha/beta hydrolase family protein [Ulvibacter sp. MAR_2010_11]|uniref:alpha/beta hydrolase family protein n=1 Tax=Ulvibacter sp. MAR_2010_11 TaxID=1250229 RepID=UPI000C2B82F1|nr:alpha/beta fold hydrolase [Ulvibacter sp. MAR_2010_11]PKA82999.1 alpha/beta hydrolase family protein [Ulvibacter sp. MAR_2010_11]
MIVQQNNILQQDGAKPVVYDFYYNDTPEAKPVVIFCHGYKGFKDWGAWHLVAKAFAEAGFYFLKFNFSHNGGTVDQPIDFPDLEAFAQNNYSKEMSDLDKVLNFIVSEIKPPSVYVIGHSRGGAIALLKAAEDARINKVVTWAGVSDFKVRFQEGSEAFKLWKQTGRTYVENSRTHQQLPHDWQFYEDFMANEERLTIKRAAQNLTKPLLLVHGGEDGTVPVKEAELLHSWNPHSKLEIIEGADHVFGASHPWETHVMPPLLKKAVDSTVDFLK